MGWARHNTCGVRQERLDLYLPDRVGRGHHSTSTLGNRQVYSLVIWLTASSIGAAPIMELAGSELGQGQVSGDRPFRLVCREGRPGDAAQPPPRGDFTCGRGRPGSPGPSTPLGPRRFPAASGSLFWNV